MAFDIFLSHYSEDDALVDKVCKNLVAHGYTVFVDSQVLPQIKPSEVTAKTAQTLRDAMKECASLFYLLSSKSGTSRWMPWELGYFDGFRGRVFVYPCDKAAEANAKGREYLKIYPLVPLRNRGAYLQKYVPRSLSFDLRAFNVEMDPAKLPRLPERLPERARAPLFDYAQQEATAVHGRRLMQDWPMASADPTVAVDAFTEILQAYWRLWGLMPPAARPGAKEGKW